MNANSELIEPPSCGEGNIVFCVIPGLAAATHAERSKTKYFIVLFSAGTRLSPGGRRSSCLRTSPPAPGPSPSTPARRGPGCSATHSRSSPATTPAGWSVILTTYLGGWTVIAEFCYVLGWVICGGHLRVRTWHQPVRERGGGRAVRLRHPLLPRHTQVPQHQHGQ